MVNIFQDLSLLRIFCFAVFLIFPVTNSSKSSILNTVSTTCCRRTYYAVQSRPKCDVWQDYAATTRSSGETMKEDMRMPRIDPIQVGFTRTVRHEDKIYTLKTLSLRPPIFEIQDFLSHDECDEIVEMAKSSGFGTSETIWSETDEVLADGNLRAIFERLDVNNDNGLDDFELLDGVRGIKDVQFEVDDLKEMFQNFGLDFLDDGKITFSEFEILTNPEMFEQIKSYLGQLEGKKTSVKSRQSFSAFLDPLVDDRRREFFEKLYQRICKVTQLPIEMIRSSESLQVIKYEVGGHYHAHHDSEDSEYAPCCHLVQGTGELCRPCRYATMFYYLNEPAEGGGTAFPFADNETYDDSKIVREEKHRLNLSNHCNKANLVYLPKKGAAIFWYNHVIDDDTGWVGALDEMSTHGGCDVIQGEKWAANNWLNAVNDREADLNIWKDYKNPLT